MPLDNYFEADPVSDASIPSESSVSSQEKSIISDVCCMTSENSPTAPLESLTEVIE